MPPAQGSQQQNDSGGISGRRGPAPLMFETFAGINTSTTRAGVPDEQAYWLNGWMPIAPRNLRTLWGVGPALYTVTPGIEIVCFYFYNIGSTPYAVLFQSDGSAVQVNTLTGATTVVLVSGTIVNSTVSQLGISQYGQQYLIIVANQTDGYWIWDGSLLYTAGTLAPGVTLTNVGAGYVSPPVVTATGGRGTGATFIVNVNAGVVSNVAIGTSGSGYFSNDTVSLVFTGGTQAGSGATVTAALSLASGSGATIAVISSPQGAFYAVSSVSVVSPGSGYPPATLLAVNGTPYEPSYVAILTPDIVNGSITAVALSGYAVPAGFGLYYPDPPSVYASISNVNYYYVSSTSIVNPGNGYGPNCAVTVSGGGSPQSQAVLTPELSDGNVGSLVGITINSGGIYGSNSPPTLTVTDSITVAAGTVSLMPFGTQGTNVETYQGRVWVFKGPLGQFTAPGSATDFSTADGGGSFTSSDSFLKVAYTQAVQTNGFLFLIADSSMNYISGVSTSGSPPTTTYTNNNSDPEIGTPYPAAVTTLGQDILAANSTGVFVSSGGAFLKKSEALDGVYNSVVNFNGKQLSAAKATIFGKRVWMVLVPIIDPVSGDTVNQIMMFNGKYWWSSLQEVPLTFIAGQEIGSVYKAWGTDGTSIYPLFQQPSSDFEKTAQTRLWDAPIGYDHTKSAVNLYVLAQFLGESDLEYTVTIDNEFGVSQTGASYSGSPVGFSWVDGAGAPFTWQDGSSQTFTWAVTGPNIVAVLPPTSVGQIGVLTGMTVTTKADDMILISVMLQAEVVGYRG